MKIKNNRTMIKDYIRGLKEALKKRKSIKKLRMVLNGFSILKRNNNLALWRNTKASLLDVSPLPVDAKLSKHLFQASLPSAEILINQYVSDILLKLWFGNRLLIAYSRNPKKICWPLPNLWISELQTLKIPTNDFLSRLYFAFLVIIIFLYNLIQSIFLIFNSNHPLDLNNSVYFDKLNRNNYLHGGEKKKYFNLITWFLEKSALSKNIQKIIVGDQNYYKYYDDNITIQSGAPPYKLRLSFFGNLQYCVWLFWALCICLYDLIFFRWWHALVLYESSKAKVVSLLKMSSIANGYYFHWSGRMLRPMWTYTLASYGKDIFLYFYSLSEQPEVLDNKIGRKADFWLLNWPNILYWSEQHKNTTQLSMRESSEGMVVGPIWFRDSEEELILPDNRFISVFCSEYYRKAFYIGSSTMVDYFEYNPNLLVRFLTDIIDVCSECDISIVHKRKRNEGRRGLKNYNNKIQQLLSSKYILADSDISPLKIISKSLGVISFPFTSVPQYAHSLGIPVVYYDASGTLSVVDPAAQGTKILRTKDELKDWLVSLPRNST